MKLNSERSHKERGGGDESLSGTGQHLVCNPTCSPSWGPFTLEFPLSGTALSFLQFNAKVKLNVKVHLLHETFPAHIWSMLIPLILCYLMFFWCPSTITSCLVIYCSIYFSRSCMKIFFSFFFISGTLLLFF